MDMWTNIGLGIGYGWMAGFVGTVAITLAQMVEMKMSGRGPSTAPADAVTKVFGFELKDEASRKKFSQLVHLEYGTKWGLFRAVLAFFGIFGWLATAIHFLAIWVTAMIMLPSLKLAPPVTQWTPKQIVSDGLLHLIYAVAAGLTYDGLSKIF